MTEEELVACFPKLARTQFVLTSPADEKYNCIAWAAGDSKKWWEPDPWGIYFWPQAAPRSYDLNAYLEAFRQLGYTLCEDAIDELGSTKIAVFAKGKSPTHAARQVGPTVWTSKLGRQVDISHELEALEGDEYGRIAHLMKRPYTSP